LRKRLKNEGEWKPYISCYLESIWYDLIGVPINQVRIESKNRYAVVYKYGRKLVKYDGGESYQEQLELQELHSLVEGKVEKVSSPLKDAKDHIREDLLVNTKEPVTRELVYNDQVGFLQVNDSGKLKYAVQAFWWKGFDEFKYIRRNIDKNDPFLSEEDKIDLEKAKKNPNPFMVLQTIKDSLPSTATRYKPTVNSVADKYMNTLFDIVKFRKKAERKPFTKEEIIRLADSKFKDKKDPSYKDFIESKLSNPLHQNYFFYEE
jgi:hypothetical protein